MKLTKIMQATWRKHVGNANDPARRWREETSNLELRLTRADKVTHEPAVNNHSYITCGPGNIILSQVAEFFYFYYCEGCRPPALVVFQIY